MSERGTNAKGDCNHDSDMCVHCMGNSDGIAHAFIMGFLIGWALCLITLMCLA